MELSKLFTEEEKVAFFKNSGFRVEKRKFKKEVKITHTWYDIEEFEMFCVYWLGSWHLMKPLFSRVIKEKLKYQLLERKVSDFALIVDEIKQMSSNEQI